MRAHRIVSILLAIVGGPLQASRARADGLAAAPEPGRHATRRVDLEVTAAGDTTVLQLRLPVGATGPLPVVLICHGWAAGPDDFSALAEHLAEHGFAAALYEQPHNWSSDTQGWAQHLAGAVDALVAQNGTAGGPLAGALDLGRLGVLGHSFGGAAAIVFAAKDPRIKACVALAPVNQWHRELVLRRAGELQVPLLVVTAEHDPLAGPGSAPRPLYEAARATPARQYVEVRGGDHNAYQNRGIGSVQHRLANRYATAWFERFLVGRTDVRALTDGSEARADLRQELLSDTAAAVLPRPVGRAFGL